MVEVDANFTQYETSVSNLSKIRATKPEVTANGWFVNGELVEGEAHKEFANTHVGAVGIARVVGTA